MVRIWIVVLGMLFIAGCKVGPRYRTPSVSVPAHFSAIKGAQESLDLCAWWQQFDDQVLNGLLNKSIQNNYSLQIAIEKIEQTRAEYALERSKLFPDIGAVGALLGTKFSKNTLLTPPTADVKTSGLLLAGFDMTWELDFWGKIRHEKDARYALYQAQIEDARDVYVMLLADIARVYIEIRALEKKLGLLDALIELEHLLIEYDQDLYCSGLESVLPVVQQKGSLDGLIAQKIMIDMMRINGLNRLATLVGEQPEIFFLDASCYAHIPDSDQMLEVGLPSDLLRNRADIRKAERQLAAASERVGAAVANWFPQFSLFGYVSFVSNKAANWFNRSSLSWVLGPMVDWSLIDFGRVAHQVEAIKSTEKQALLYYQEAFLNALKDVENSVIEYIKTCERITAIQDQLAYARKEIALRGALFEAGLSDNRSVLQAQMLSLQIELTLVDLQQQKSTALVAVYKALGGGW